MKYTLGFSFDRQNIPEPTADEKKSDIAGCKPVVEVKKIKTEISPVLVMKTSCIDAVNVESIRKLGLRD